MLEAADAMHAIVRFAREYYAGLDFAHDVAHGERVVHLAKRIAAEEGGDAFLIEAGAWLHQLHDDLGRLEGFLSSLAIEEALRRRLFEIVRDCHPARIGEHSSPEARVVFDADALEVLGPYGSVRELLCNAIARGRSWAESVQDARDVQRQFRARLMTDTARRLAAEPIRVAERFWELYDGWRDLTV